MATSEVGALSMVTEETLLSALKCVSRGKVVSLAQTYEIEMPTVGFHGPFFYSTFRTYEQTIKQFKQYENRLGSLVCRYELSDHTGTHVDSLNHASAKFELYGGVDAREVLTETGTTRLGINTMPPVVTRGVLLDFPRFKGTEMLDFSYEITVADIESLVRREEIDVRAGDALLFYTGRCKLWMKDNARYLSNAPGPGMEAAKWISKKGIAITGADTSSFEVEPKDSKLLFPSHQILIKQNGIHLIENMKLDELAETGVKEFLFICAPLKFKGGAGSPVAPIAVL